MGRLVGCGVFVVAWLSSAPVVALDVTACGTVVSGTSGVLRADLACPGAGPVCLYPAADGTTAACSTDADCGAIRGGPCVPIAVGLGKGATVDLGGHSITGAGVLCRGPGRCRVTGPGYIAGAPVGIVGHAPLRVDGLDVRNGSYGIYAWARRVRVEHLNVTGNAYDGITSVKGQLRAEDVNANDNGGAGLDSSLWPLRGKDVHALRNGGNGMNAASVRVLRLTVEDNVGYGASSLNGIVAPASSIVRNAVASGGIDVIASRRPVLRGSVCDHSSDGAGGTWGVCRLDAGVTTTTVVTTSTTTSTLVLCETSAPACGGPCPSGGTCGAATGGCGCTFPAPPLKDVAATTGRIVGAAVRSAQLANEPLYAATVAREYDSLGTDFEAIWSNIHPAQGVYTFGGLDGIVAFAQAHGLRVQGDPLVWHGYLPDYVSSLSSSALAAELEDHVRSIVRRYRGQIGSWIVVNEAVADPGGALRSSVFLNQLGPGYIANAFTWAHEEDPDARLFYNDYSADGLNPKSDYIYSLVQGLLAAGVPIHGVGLQMHTGGVFGPPSATVKANIQLFVDLG